MLNKSANLAEWTDSNDWTETDKVLKCSENKYWNIVQRLWFMVPNKDEETYLFVTDECREDIMWTEVLYAVLGND